MEIIWKAIEGFEGYYEISNSGQVRSLDRFIYCKSKKKPNLFKSKILKQMFDRYGYLVVNLKKESKSYLKKVHRLVATAFISNENQFEAVNHIDGCKTNNAVDNLEWCSFKQNAQHRTKNLLVEPVLDKSQVLDIIRNCKPAKNQIDKENSISHYARKYHIDNRTVADILYGRKLYLEKLCK